MPWDVIANISCSNHCILLLIVMWSLLIICTCTYSYLHFVYFSQSLASNIEIEIHAVFLDELMLSISERRSNIVVVVAVFRSSTNIFYIELPSDNSVLDGWPTEINYNAPVNPLSIIWPRGICHQVSWGDDVVTNDPYHIELFCDFSSALEQY